MTDDEDRALDLLGDARKKLARAATLVPDMSGDFAEMLRDLDDLADDISDGDDEEDDCADDED